MNSNYLNPPVFFDPFDNYRKQSPLHACGYKVGVDAPLRSTREGLLLRFFRADLRSRFDSSEYEELGASEWGAPGSRKRWERMLSHLSWQRERQGAQGRCDAARHLDEDLTYIGRLMLIQHLE